MLILLIGIVSGPFMQRWQCWITTVPLQPYLINTMEDIIVFLGLKVYCLKYVLHIYCICTAYVIFSSINYSLSLIVQYFVIEYLLEAICLNQHIYRVHIVSYLKRGSMEDDLLAIPIFWRKDLKEWEIDTNILIGFSYET